MTPTKPSESGGGSRDRPLRPLRRPLVHLPDEFVATLLEAANVGIDRIVLLWYDQEQHEWVVMLTGAARLRFEDGTVEMKPGDFMNVPAHERHRVEWTPPDEPTVRPAVHYEGNEVEG